MQRLYYGGDIITMRAETDAPEALLVSDGKIAYVGELLEARKRCLPGAEEIDLGGRTLMPSFIDAHSHIAMLAQYTDFVIWGNVRASTTWWRRLPPGRRRKASERAISWWATAMITIS